MKRETNHVIATGIAGCLALWALLWIPRIDNRLTTQEEALRAFFDAFTNHLSVNHGLKFKTVHSGLTWQEASNLHAAAKQVRSETSLDREIKRIKREHNHNWEMQKSSLMAGYTACRLGMSLSNYLAEVEAEQAKLLERRITEAKEDKP